MPTHYRGTASEVRALNTFIKLTRAASSLEGRLAHRNTLGDLTPSQFGVLESLYHLGPLRQREIGDKLLKSGGNITVVVDNLVRLELVKRERDASDRRAVLVSLTGQGRLLVERILPAHVAAIVAELSTLTPEEQETLGQLCRKLGRAGFSG
jgi:MarR family 2-MHQ and catechol resistance regulon transcriptional repressor